jgi:hypothetical protein
MVYGNGYYMLAPEAIVLPKILPRCAVKFCCAVIQCANPDKTMRVASDAVNAHVIKRIRGAGLVP